MRKFFDFFFVTVFVSFLISCSQGNPEIRSHIVQLLLVEQPTRQFSERLSVFVFIEDTDGPEDFGKLTITHEESGLYWTIDRNSLMVRIRGKDRWLGSNALAGPGEEKLPEGRYIMVYSDLAGNEALQVYTLTRPQFPEKSPITFNISDQEWIVQMNPETTNFSRIYFYLLDGGLSLLQTWRLPNTSEKSISGTVESLRVMARNTTTVQCFIENSTGSAGVLLLPVDLE